MSKIVVWAEVMDIPELRRRAQDMRDRALRGPALTDRNGKSMRRTPEDIEAHRRHNAALAEEAEAAAKIETIRAGKLGSVTRSK